MRKFEIRYPGDLPEPSQREAEEALVLAEGIAETIKERLK